MANILFSCSVCLIANAKETNLRNGIARIIPSHFIGIFVFNDRTRPNFSQIDRLRRNDIMLVISFCIRGENKFERTKKENQTYKLFRFHLIYTGSSVRKRLN